MQSSLPAPPAASQILQTLKPGHPRLLADAARFAAMRELTATNAIAARMLADIRKSADRMLKEPVSKYDIPDGLRLLAVSRRVMTRIDTLAMAYRMTGQSNYAERAWQELAAAAAFPDWNPRHFLDTAEMTHAFAIGYDWLYDYWTPARRDTLRGAILRHGLAPALECYRGTTHDGWWTKAHHNWNQVCNGGIGMGALSIADELPALAAEILHDAVASLPLALSQYAPDGAWAEGPGYWDYATTFTVLFIASLDSALGDDFGLSRIDGLAQTGRFPLQMTGPTGLAFNYADAGEERVADAALLWLASRYREPQFAAQRLDAGRRGEPQDLLWYDPALAHAPQMAAPPLAKHFRRADVMAMRTGWDTNAIFVACKAGDNQANHSHLDLGTFVVEALGRRFVSDLGGDDYNLPGYFGSKRYDYYRLRAEGHNTLVIDPDAAPDQDPKAAAVVTKFTATDTRALTVMDLTPAYTNHARRVQRGVVLIHPCATAPMGCVQVQDEVELRAAGDIWWFLHTPAQIALGKDGITARLTVKGEAMDVRLAAPPGARFAVMAAVPLMTSPQPPRQGTNDAMHKLAMHLEQCTRATIRVELTPVKDGVVAGYAASETVPLAEW